MRAQYLILLSPLVLAACGDSPPPQQPIIIAPPAAQAPQQQPTTVILQTMQPAPGNLVSQCQSLFAQSLAGQNVTYGSPAVGSSGNVVTVRLSATSDMLPGSLPMVYSCSYSNNTLISAGRG